jgi:integrase
MNGAPLMVVAKNLGHSDTRIVETHYGHLAPSYVAEAIKKHAPKFGKVAPSNISEI